MASVARAARFGWALLVMASLGLTSVPAAAGSAAAPTPGSTIVFATDPTATMTALPAANVMAGYGGATLIYSDDPEHVGQPGVLYADPAVAGAFRVFAYHENVSASSLYFAVVAANPGNTPVTVTVTAIGEGGPSPSPFVAAGKAAEGQWFGPQSPYSVSLQPGQTAFLDRSLHETAVPPDEVANVVLDASTSAAVEVAVVAQASPSLPTQAQLHAMTVLPAVHSRARRGTFAQDALTYTVSAQPGQYVYHLGDGVNPPYLMGVDKTTGGPALDSGDYGVLMQANLALSTPHGQADVALLVNPRGGDWAGVGTVSAGLTPAGEVLLPAHRLYASPYYDGVVLGDYRVQPHAQTAATIAWMQAAASSLPVDLLVYPYKGH